MHHPKGWKQLTTLIAASFIAIFPTKGHAAKFYVNSAENAGQGTLREAIEKLNKHPDPKERHFIQFESDLGTIHLDTPLPPIRKNVIIGSKGENAQEINFEKIFKYPNRVFEESENITSPGLVIEKGKVTLENCKISHAKSILSKENARRKAEGAVFVGAEGELVLDHTVFEDCALLTPLPPKPGVDHLFAPPIHRPDYYEERAGGEVVVDDKGQVTVIKADFVNNSREEEQRDLFLVSGANANFRASNEDVILTSPIEGSARDPKNPGELIKTGPKTLDLSGCGVNTFPQDMVIKEGSVAVSQDANLGQQGNTVVFDGGALKIEESFPSQRPIKITEKEGTIVVAEGKTLELSGNIEGEGLLKKKGMGTLKLTGENDLSGEIRVYEDGVQGNAESLSGNIKAEANTTVTFDQSKDGVYEHQMSGEGSLIKEGEGTLVLAGENTYKGGTEVREGTVAASSDANLGSKEGDLILNGGKFEATEPFVMNHNMHLKKEGRVGVSQDATLTLKGDMLGEGALTKEGPGTLHLLGVKQYAGKMTIAGGVIKGNTASIVGPVTVHKDTPLIFDQQGYGLYKGHLSGHGDFIKEGEGHVRIAEDCSEFLGNTYITRGKLSLDKSLGGTIFVGVGGTLGGVGKVVGSLINHGLVAPGNSIGTFHIEGNYNQAPGGRLYIEVNNKGEASQVNVDKGATLDGALLVGLNPGLYESKKYSIVQGEEVNGKFNREITSSPIDFSVAYFPKHVELTLTGAVTRAPLDLLCCNGKTVGDLFFQKGFVPSDPDMRTVLNQICYLSPNDFTKTFSQLGPAQFGALPLANLQASSRITASMTEGVNSYHRYCFSTDDEEGMSNFWLEPIATYYNQKQVEEQIPFNVKTYGLSVGVEKIYHNHFTIGTTLNYSYSDLKWSQKSGKASWNTVRGGGYLGYSAKNFYTALLLLGGYSSYDVNRDIQIASITDSAGKKIMEPILRTAKNDHSSWDVLGAISGGGKIPLAQIFESSFFIMPEAKVVYLRIQEESYTESGAKSLNLSVDDKISSFLQPEVTLRLGNEMSSENFCILPSLLVGWVRTIPLSDSDYTAEFKKGCSYHDSFTVTSFEESTNQLLLGAELVVTSKESFLFKLGYEATLGNQYKVQEGSMRLNWRF